MGALQNAQKYQMLLYSIIQIGAKMKKINRLPPNSNRFIFDLPSGFSKNRGCFDRKLFIVINSSPLNYTDTPMMDGLAHDLHIERVPPCQLHGSPAIVIGCEKPDTSAPFWYTTRRLITTRTVSEAAIFSFIIIRSLWYLASTSTAVLPMCLSHFNAMQ